MNEFIRLTE